MLKVVDPKGQGYKRDTEISDGQGFTFFNFLLWIKTEKGCNSN